MKLARNLKTSFRKSKFFKKIVSGLVKPKFLYFFIIIIGLSVRLINLNYNSPYTDEAIYVVVGKLGIFQRDWWTYNASAWMGGSHLIYPALTSIAYVTGGILASRFLNVIFGVLSIELVVRISGLMVNKLNRRIFAGLTAAFILALASPAIYTSRLATYDMPSFYFSLLGFYFLLSENGNVNDKGKKYFLSAFFFTIGILTKFITVIYLPFIVIFSFLRAKNLSGTQKRKMNNLYFWKIYFIPVIIAGIGFYTLFNFSSLYSFFTFQINGAKASYILILAETLKYIFPVLLLFAISSIGFLFKKEVKTWLILSVLAFLPVMFHLYTRREAALEKHLTLTVLFLAIGIGLGFSNLFKIINIPKIYKYGVLSLLLVFFSLTSLYQYYNSYKGWSNASSLSEFLRKNIKGNNRVLAENGPEVILATYEVNFPINTTTFDYFKYNNRLDIKAYEEAVVDGYFDYIQFENKRLTTIESHEKIYSQIADKLNENYSLAFTDPNFSVYKRNY